MSKTFDKKAEAQGAGRVTAKRDRTEHIIHKKDGSPVPRVDVQAPGFSVDTAITNVKMIEHAP